MKLKKQDFLKLGKKEPKYVHLFNFFKGNKNYAYDKVELLNGICKEIAMTEGQLNISLYIWVKMGYLENKRTFYIITEKGLDATGKCKYDKEKKTYVPN